MNFVLFIVIVLLFVALTPGILVSLPPKSTKLVVALTHGVVFAVVWTLIHKPIWRLTHGFRFEGFNEGVDDEDEKKKDESMTTKEGVTGEKNK